MDSSQSSDAFSDFTNQSGMAASNIMDANAYDSLLDNTKSALRNITALNNPSFYDHFASVLEDCRLCVSQTLNLLNEVLLETDIQAPKLGPYLEDAVTIIHLLSNFIKNIVESVSISCCTVKVFPITTGQIIMDVFIHCKNSETTYGAHLSQVQQQLKDLFRTCHELQLTYLMVLEKHFVFDLSEKDELDILVEALKINLHIGEVVQALDVKTMADQWKAYTAICDKYSSYLIGTTVYQDCAMLICAMILNNLKTSLEVELEEKLVIRSMKITNFTIKILTKMFTIFKDSQVKPHKCIVDLLSNVFIYQPTYLETMEQKSPQFINIVTTNVLTPADLLLKELFDDETFVNTLLNYNVSNIRENDEILGYTFIIVAFMKSVSQKNYKNAIAKSKIINCLLDLVPDCYVWMNMGMKFEVDRNHPKMKSVGLFDYLLLHTTNVALNMSCDEYCALEKAMCEALLGVDSVRALFVANLWVIITRVTNNKQLLNNQLVSLCQMYQKLENHSLFARSPQNVHLTNVISRLFEIADLEARVKIYKHFNPLISPKNISLWCVLKISRLPIEFQRTIEEDIVDKFKTEFQKFTSVFQSNEPYHLINAMKLAATCSCQVLEGVEDILLEGWARACPKHLHFLSAELPINVLWFVDYVEALVSLTCAMKYAVYGRSSYVIKFHFRTKQIFEVLDGVEDILLEAWARACPKNLHFLSAELPINVLWFLDYVEALVSLTCAMKYAVYGRSSYVIKILHVIDGLIKLGNAEIKLLAIDLLCKLATNQIHDDNKAEAGKLINETFKILIQDSDVFIRNTFLRMVRNFDNKYLDQIVNSIVCGNQSLFKVWQEFRNNRNEKTKRELYEHLSLVNNFKYRHKCVEYKDVNKYITIAENRQNSCNNSGNFDFADIESLFDNNVTEEPASKKLFDNNETMESASKKVFHNNETIEPASKKVFGNNETMKPANKKVFDKNETMEPVSKKVKLDTTEVETILDRLEQDTTLLCDIRENLFTYKHKKRIRLLYERLVSIVSNE